MVCCLLLKKIQDCCLLLWKTYYISNNSKSLKRPCLQQWHWARKHTEKKIISLRNQTNWTSKSKQETMKNYENSKPSKHIKKLWVNWIIKYLKIHLVTQSFFKYKNCWSNKEIGLSASKLVVDLNYTPFNHGNKHREYCS